MWYRQNHLGRLGGPMAFEKAIWLSFAIYGFIVLPTAFAFDARLSPDLRLAFQAVAAWWWFRVVAELVLMYGFHAWKPPYGVGHNLVCIGLLVGAGTLMQGHLPAMLGAQDANAWRYLWGLALLLVLESSYAVMFFQARGGDTATIWYAHWGEDRFHKVMWWTRINQCWALPLIWYTAWAYAQP